MALGDNLYPKTSWRSLGGVSFNLGGLPLDPHMRKNNLAN